MERCTHGVRMRAILTLCIGAKGRNLAFSCVYANCRLYCSKAGVDNSMLALLEEDIEKLNVISLRKLIS